MYLINTVLNILVKYCGYVAFLKVNTSKYGNKGNFQYGNKDNFYKDVCKRKKKFNMSFPTLWCKQKQQ